MKAGKTITRIFAGFGAAVILAIMTLGVFAYTRLRTIKGTATRITNDAMPCIYLMGKLQSATLLHYTLLTDYMNADDKSGKAALDGQIENANSEIDDVMRKYERLIDDAEDRRLYEALKAARTPYTECYVRVLRLSRKGKRNEALNLITTGLIPLRDAVFKAAEAEVVWNKADADDAANAIMSAVNWSSTGILISLALSVGIGGIARDIRKRLRAERTLREGEQRFRGVFEHAPFGMCVSGLDGRFMQVNAAFCRMLGYSEEELLGRAWSELTHPDDLELSLGLKEQLRNQPDGCAEAEKRYIHRSGAVVWAHIKVATIRDPGGTPPI
jgi:PAS domain S-box-containing protein